MRNAQTSAEQRLWRALDRVPLTGTHFRRQVPIGPYVVDLACLTLRLVIEVDGPSHAEDGAPERDRVRQGWLEREGFRVLRFWNDEVFSNLDGVLDTIQAAVSLRMPGARRIGHPTPDLRSDPPREGEGGRT